jgi:hypothetical protein
VAIEFVGGNTAGKLGATSGNTTIALNGSLTGGIASAVAAGDLVIAAFATGSAADRTLAITDGTTGYTLIDSELHANDTEQTNLRVAYKFMGGTPDASTTFGPTGNIADAGAMAVYVFRGVDTSTPLDVAAVPATALNTQLANPGPITPTTAGAYIVCVGAGAREGLGDFSSSDLTDFRTQSGSNDTNDITLGVGHKPDWASGEFNPAAWTHSVGDSVNYSWAAMTIALRPIPADTTDDLLADDVASASSVTAAVLAQVHVLNAADVASASALTAPVIAQAHVLTADDVASASSLTAPVLGITSPLLADDVASASSVSAPVIAQVHALSADDVASASSVATPAITQVHGITADDVASASSLSAPALAQVQVLSADDVASQSSVGAPAITQAHVLLADDVLSASSVSAPAIGDPGDAEDNLTADDVASASSVSVPVFTQVHALTADDVFAASGISVPVAQQIIVLSAPALTAQSSVSAPALTQIHTILADDVSSVSSLSLPVLSSGILYASTSRLARASSENRSASFSRESRSASNPTDDRSSSVAASSNNARVPQ